ncbi:MAG TPA: hypothetical protein VNU97_10340 [Rhizomicrobium sp.]|jgi:hypothetical protein|nr:hypothetical protein [Rhizomicrobium sp.]
MADGPPPFDWNKLFSKENQPKLIVAIVGVVALIVVMRFAGMGDLPSAPANPGTVASGGAAPNAGVEPPGAAAPTGSGPVPLTPVAAGQCQTSAPDGWTVTDTNPNSTIFSLTSSDHSMIAAYAGLGMPPIMTPSQMVQQMIASATGAPVNVLSDGQSFGDYQVMTFSSGTYGGYVLYYKADGIHDYTLPAEAQNFILIARIAMGANGDKHSLATAGSVAAAIRCHAIFIPKPIGGDSDRSSGHGAGTSAKCSGGGGCDDSDLAGTYNVQLGTGWAHDSLGRNFNVDVTTDWDDNGPDGPGYYANVGGTREKLQGGLE